MFYHCSFSELPSFCKDLRGMNLAPSLWTGAPLSVCERVRVQPGDQVKIAGIDGSGGIYIQIEDGTFIGTVSPDCLTPWRLPEP